MDYFELPDIGLIPCTFVIPGIDVRCGSGLQLVAVERRLELEPQLTVRCGLGHEASGTLLGLFSWWDLAVPALYFLEADHFRELELMVQEYHMFVSLAAANNRAINTSRHDQMLRKWAANHAVVPYEVWVVAREHWNSFDKPTHVAVTGGWMPDVFDPRQWA